jgi:Domain of Unknown Function (DUF1206)
MGPATRGASTLSLSNFPAPATEAPAVTHHARHAASAGVVWVGRFLRFGHIVRGILYMVLGILALRLALGTRGEALTQTGAIQMIGHQPFGFVLLAAVAIGLACYSVWSAIHAFLDPLRNGHTFRGLARRVAFASNALVYAGLLVVTLQVIVGPLPYVPTSFDWTASLLARTSGAALVGIIGVCWIAIACVDIVSGLRGAFKRDLDLDRRSPAERRWAMALGRVGIVVRATVFAIIGIFLVATALHINAHHATGTDGALLGLLRQSFGRALLATAGLGLIAFGVFSAMCSRWMRSHAAGLALR